MNQGWLHTGQESSSLYSLPSTGNTIPFFWGGGGVRWCLSLIWQCSRPLLAGLFLSPVSIILPPKIKHFAEKEQHIQFILSSNQYSYTKAALRLGIQKIETIAVLILMPGER